MFHTYKYDRSPPTPPSSTNPISRQDLGQNWSQQLVSFKIKISRRQLLFLSKSRLKAQKLAGAVERTGPDQRVRMLASSRFVLTAHLRSWRSFKGLKMFGSRGLLSETDEPENQRRKNPPGISSRMHKHTLQSNQNCLLVCVCVSLSVSTPTALNNNKPEMRERARRKTPSRNSCRTPALPSSRFELVAAPFFSVSILGFQVCVRVCMSVSERHPERNQGGNNRNEVTSPCTESSTRQKKAHLKGGEYHKMKSTRREMTVAAHQRKTSLCK